VQVRGTHKSLVCTKEPLEVIRRPGKSAWAHYRVEIQADIPNDRRDPL
jgi:hypothetical protein